MFILDIVSPSISYAPIIAIPIIAVAAIAVVLILILKRK